MSGKTFLVLAVSGLAAAFAARGYWTDGRRSRSAEDSRVPAKPSYVLSVFGGTGLEDGRFNTPRSVAYDGKEEGKGSCYVIDRTDRVQVFDVATGKFQRLWHLPDISLGRPEHILWTPDGTLYITDTHYGRVLHYDAQGKLLDAIGEEGTEPGQLHYPVGACLLEGNLCVSEYGGHDRIQRFSREGKLLGLFGSHGPDPGHFMRPQALAASPDGKLYVADSANHRIQVFSMDGNLLAAFGEIGSGRGQLFYPFDLGFDAKGRLLVLECGNHRLSLWSAEGAWLGKLGKVGSEPGELANPRGMCLLGDGTVLIADSDNHRLQRWRLPE